MDCWFNSGFRSCTVISRRGISLACCRHTGEEAAIVAIIERISNAETGGEILLLSDTLPQLCLRINHSLSGSTPSTVQTLKETGFQDCHVFQLGTWWLGPNIHCFVVPTASYCRMKGSTYILHRMYDVVAGIQPRERTGAVIIQNCRRPVMTHDMFRR